MDGLSYTPQEARQGPPYPFAACHQDEAQESKNPLFLLRKALLDSNTLLSSGRINPESPVKKLTPSPLENKKIKKLLNHSFSLTESIEIPIFEFVKRYLMENPEQDIHLTGSSLPLNADWFQQVLSQALFPKECQPYLLASLDQIFLHYSDIDLRIMIPRQSKGKGYHEMLTELANKPIPQNTAFPINSLTTVATYNGSPCSIDIITCRMKKPSHLTTTDGLYISLKEWLATKSAVPKLADDSSFGEWLIHRLSKIFFVDQKLNYGALKRLIQFQTYGFITPEKGLVERIIQVFQPEKNNPEKFENYFALRQSHLIPNPKTELAFCLNIISNINEYFPPEKKLTYWRICPKFIKHNIQKGLLVEVAKYVEHYSYGCEYLMTTLKMCSLICLMGKRSFLMEDALPVIMSSQNGEPYVSLFLNKTQNAAVHFKFDPLDTITKLLDIFRPAFISKDTRPRLDLLAGMLLRFMMYIMKKEKHLTIKEDKTRSQIASALNSIRPKDEPILHFLNLFWRGLSSHAENDESKILSSLIPALLLLNGSKSQKMLLKHLNPVSSNAIKKLESTLKDNRPLNYTSLYEVLIRHHLETSSEKAYKLWSEAACSSLFDEETKCRLLCKIVENTKPKRLINALKENKADPLVLIKFLSFFNQLQAQKHYRESKEWSLAADILIQTGPSQNNEFIKECLNIFKPLLACDIYKAWEIACFLFPFLSNDKIHSYIEKLLQNSNNLDRKRIHYLLPSLTIALKKLHPVQIANHLIRLSSLNITLKDNEIWSSTILQLAKETKLAWNLLQLGETRVKKDQSKCLAMIGSNCRGEHLPILRSALQKLRKLDENPSPLFRELQKKEISFLINQNDSDEVFKSIDTLISSLGNQKDGIKELRFWIHQLKKEYFAGKQNLGFAAISLWKSYEARFKKTDPIWITIYRIMLREKKHLDCWSLITKRNSLVLGDDIESEINRTKIWNQLLESSFNKNQNLNPKLYGVFFDLICRDICDIRKKITHEDLSVKAYQWHLMPQGLINKVPNPKLEDELYTLRCRLIDKIVIGIWSLRQSNNMKSKKRLKTRLDIVGSILWIRTKDEITMKFHNEPFKDVYEKMIDIYKEAICNQMNIIPETSLGTRCFEIYDNLSPQKQKMIEYFIRGLLGTLLFFLLTYCERFIFTQKS